MRARRIALQNIHRKRPPLARLRLQTLWRTIAAAGAFALLSGLMPAPEGILVGPAQLVGHFLLQTSYEQDGPEPFMTSRSRIVTFRREGASLHMIEVAGNAQTERLLARIPIRDEADGTLLVDFNAGFDRIFLEEDRTGSDYWIEEQTFSSVRLVQREISKAVRSGPTLVLEQHAVDTHERAFVVHYYLRPYRSNPGFEPSELSSLDHLGFFQTYPRQLDGSAVLYATKFDIRKPVVFALSANVPSEHREAVRDGALYWNRAFGRTVVRVIDAPEAAIRPDSELNVIEWKTKHVSGSTSHIQIDPLTGQILHAYVFIAPFTVANGISADAHGHHLRYVVAHEVGHALGLRHNFARGPVTTVMNYLSAENAAIVGRDVIARNEPALAYDAAAIRAVYLDQPIDVATVPAFCTDYQDECKRGAFEARGATAALPRERTTND